MNQSYAVKYKMFWGDSEKMVTIAAKSKFDAYRKADAEVIPAVEGGYAYSLWVSSVTYQNGNYREFNTCEGLPY